MPLGIPFRAPITLLWQIRKHFRQIHGSCRSRRTTSSPLRGRPRLRFGFSSFLGFGAGFSRASIAVESRDVQRWLSRRGDQRFVHPPRIKLLRDGERRGHPHSRRNTGSASIRSIRSRVVGIPNGLGKERAGQRHPVRARTPHQTRLTRQMIFGRCKLQHGNQLAVPLRQPTDSLGHLPGTSRKSAPRSDTLLNGHRGDRLASVCGRLINPYIPQGGPRVLSFLQVGAGKPLEPAILLSLYHFSPGPRLMEP